MNALADALRLAEELKHPLTTVIALWFAAWVHYHRGDRVATKAVVERALTLAADYGISGWSDTRVVLPWVSGARLDRRELAELNDQIPKVASTAWRRVFSRCALAKLYIAAGHFDEGLAVLGEGISTADRAAFYGQKFIGLRASCALKLRRPIRVTRKRAFARRSILPARVGRNRSHCAPPRALPSSGAATAAMTRRARCWRRSTAPSARASSCRTSRKPRLCWTRLPQFRSRD